MDWLRKLFTREADPSPRSVVDLAEIGERVELIGRVEAPSPLHCPVTHDPAVVIHYRARPIGRFEVDVPTPFTVGEQATPFVLRDLSGTALIEVDSGVDVAEIHQRLLHTHGVALELDIALIRPGDEVCVQGHVLERARDGDHGERWTTVVVADAITRVD